MTKRSLIRTCSVVCSLTLLGTATYGQDKPIKKDLKLTSIPKNINNPYMVIQSNGAMDACKEGETFAAGGLGNRTVGKDRVVLLGPLTVFTTDNIDQFNFQQTTQYRRHLALPPAPVTP